MHILRERFKNEEKKLKRHLDEYATLKKIIMIFIQSRTYEDLCDNPLLRMYHFEELKYELNGFHSCKLSKGRGVIRLIFKIHKKESVIELVFISMNHYEDFKRTLKESDSV